MVFGLIAEGAGHAAAGAVERLDGDAGHSFERGDAGAHGVERFLVAVAVQQHLGRRTAAGGDLEATGGGLLRDELLKELGAPRERLWLLAGQEPQELVAQREEAGGLKADDRRAAVEMGPERGEHALRLGLGFRDEAGREEGAAAAERTLARGRRIDRAVAGALQHPLGGTGVL